MSHRSITTTLMGMGFVVMALLMGVSSAALAAGTLTVDWPNNNIDLVAGMVYPIKKINYYKPAEPETLLAAALPWF